jgi:hypothetical protein
VCLCTCAQLFSMPQLWRDRSFTFGGWNESESKRAVRFIQILGTFLRNLEVEVRACSRNGMVLGKGGEGRGVRDDGVGMCIIVLKQI